MRAASQTAADRSGPCAALALPGPSAATDRGSRAPHRCSRPPSYRRRRPRTPFEIAGGRRCRGTGSRVFGRRFGTRSRPRSPAARVQDQEEYPGVDQDDGRCEEDDGRHGRKANPCARGCNPDLTGCVLSARRGSVGPIVLPPRPARRAAGEAHVSFHVMAAGCGGIVYRGMQGPTSLPRRTHRRPGSGTPPTAAPPGWVRLRPPRRRTHRPGGPPATATSLTGAVTSTAPRSRGTDGPESKKGHSPEAPRRNGLSSGPRRWLRPTRLRGDERVLKANPHSNS